MASKRSNPFQEDFVKQSKIHVGLKQFNNNIEGMKTVHVKTLELLFKGAKKQGVHQELNHQTKSVVTPRDKMKQLIITKEGKLEHCVNLERTNLLFFKCKCDKPADAKCAYCETEVCGTCSLICSCCTGLFCTRCLLIGFEDKEVCISCCR